MTRYNIQRFFRNLKVALQWRLFPNTIMVFLKEIREMSFAQFVLDVWEERALKSISNRALAYNIGRAFYERSNLVITVPRNYYIPDLANPILLYGMAIYGSIRIDAKALFIGANKVMVRSAIERFRSKLYIDIPWLGLRSSNSDHYQRINVSGNQSLVALFNDYDNVKRGLHLSGAMVIEDPSILSTSETDHKRILGRYIRVLEPIPNRGSSSQFLITKDPNSPLANHLSKLPGWKSFNLREDG